MSATLTKGQRLAQEAQDAAEFRDALTHPDVVALRVERIRTRVDRCVWLGMILGLLFTMTNVQQFAADATNAKSGSLAWLAAWVLDPTVSVILLGVLIAEREVSRWRVQMGGWARVAKWSLLAATYTMNTWSAYVEGSVAGIVLHSIPPLVVFVGAEALSDCNTKLTEAVQAALTHAADRTERRARAEQVEPPEQTAVPERVEPTPPPVAPAERPEVPAPEAPPIAAQDAPQQAENASEEPTHALVPVRPARQPARRASGRTAQDARKRDADEPQTDDQLADAVLKLVDQTGKVPSQYSIKQTFSIGSGRANRVLDLVKEASTNRTVEEVMAT